MDRCHYAWQRSRALGEANEQGAEHDRFDGLGALGRLACIHEFDVRDVELQELTPKPSCDLRKLLRIGLIAEPDLNLERGMPGHDS